MQYVSILSLSVLSSILLSQERTLVGRIVTDNFEPAGFAQIQTLSGKPLGSADANGYFSISMGSEMDSVVIVWVAYRAEYLGVKNIDTLNLIMLPERIIEFDTYEQEVSFEKKRNKKREKLYKHAYEQGVFDH